MGYTHGTPKDAVTRVCTCCGKEFPNTIEYFNYAKKKLGTLKSLCKICDAKRNKEKNDHIRKEHENFDYTNLYYDGVKQCLKCHRELPNNYLYFPADKTCKTGLRNVCRECNPKYSRFLSADYVPQKKWTEEEDNLFRLYYKDYTGEQLQKLYFPNRSIRAIESHADILGICGKSELGEQAGQKQKSEKLTGMFLGRVMSEETKQKLSASRKEYYKTHDVWSKGIKLTPERCKAISERMKGKWAGDKNPRHINPLDGSANGRWKGGVLSIKNEMRTRIPQWKEDAMIICDYKCVITGLSFKHIHHTTSFTDILHETIENIGTEVKSSVGLYTEEEIKMMERELNRLHDYYGFGACIDLRVHKLFHDKYGYEGFTPEDFLEFMSDISDGKYNWWFDIQKLPININKDYLIYLQGLCSELRNNNGYQKVG